MAGMNGDEIRHAVQPGAGDRDLAVVRPREPGRVNRIERTVAGDDAELPRARAPRAEGAWQAVGPELLPGRAVDRAVKPDRLQAVGQFAAGIGRSEERRVGKECRSRWSPYH